MIDWSPREFEIQLAFPGNGEYQALIFEDGVNADRYASDDRKYETTAQQNEKLGIKLAPGGGWAARIWKNLRRD